MNTTQGAAHNYIMPTTRVPRQRIKPKTLGVTCNYFTTLPLNRRPGTELISCSPRICFLVQATTDGVPGHYVVMSCTLGCFHSCHRLKLTLTIIAIMQKSGSHIPYILYEDCLRMWADLRELDCNIVACTRKQILRLQDMSSVSGLNFYLSQWQSGKITACHPKGLRFDSQTGYMGCGHYVVRSCTLGCFHSYPRLKLTLP